MTSTPVLASCPLGTAGADSLELLAFVAMVAAVVAVARVPASQWAHGYRSKTGWILAALALTIDPWGLAMPLGALVSLLVTRRVRRRALLSSAPVATSSVWDGAQR